MTPVFIATLAGLATALFWGVADWLSSKSSKKLKPLEINFAVQAASILLAALVFAVSALEMPDAGQLWRIVLSAVMINSAYLLFVKALTEGVLGIVAPLGNSYPLVTLLLAVTFLDEVFTVLQVMAMLIIVVGAAALVYEKNHKKIPLRELHRDTIYATGAAIVWGVGFFIIAPVTEQLSWQTITVVSEIAAFSYACLLLVAVYRSKILPTIKRALSSKTSLVIGIAGTSGLASLYLGSAKAGSIIIPAVLSSGAPLVASFLGAIFDNEKLGLLKRVGAMVIVVGIIILNVA